MKRFFTNRPSRISIMLMIASLFAPLLPGPAQTASSTTGSAPSPTPTPVPVKPTQTPVQISFNGVTKFREKQLLDAISEQIDEIRDTGLTGASADDAAFFLAIFYHKQGYPNTDVKPVIKGDQLTLNVNEGLPAAVEEATFNGNEHIPSLQLRDYLLGATRERLSLMQRQLPYIAADIETGVERIRGLYLSQGFLDSIIDPAEIRFSKDQTRVIINVTVHEGMQYWFGKPHFTGDLVFYPQSDLLKELDPLLKQPFTPAQVTSLQRKVMYFYRSRGYFDVKVNVESDPANAKDGVVPLEFTVESGNVYRFGGVKVTGLDRLQSDFLPRRFAKLKGAFYNPSRLDEIYREMMRTGLFKSLRITSTPLPSHEVELDMEVEEAKAKEIGFSGGYGTFEGPILGLHLGDRDLFGTGRPITSTFEFSARLLRGELVYTDPWFLETPNKLKLRVFSSNQDWYGYSVLEAGVRAELTRKLTDSFEATIFAGSKHANVTSKGILPSELGDTHYFINSVGASFTLDLRNNTNSPSYPGRGLVVRGATEVASKALGSTVDFVRATANVSYYIPIRKTLLAFGASGGIIDPFGSEEIPINERFFNGGSRSVRSFDERKLGPHDISGNPIGGENFTTLNMEYTFPVYGDLEMAVFTDAGTVGHNVSSGGQMRYGIGTGLRYRLPVGPLRLDYGMNPAPKPGESSGAIHFSFGFAF